MDTTVIGWFSTRPRATLATARLLSAGFADHQIRVVDADSPGRREFFGERADLRRGALVGLCFGLGAGLLAGAALATVFDVLVAVLGGLFVGVCWGAVLGLLVSRATATSSQAELERHVDSGGVLVSVSTDGGQAARAKEVLVAEGTSMVTMSSPLADRAVPGPDLPSSLRDRRVPIAHHT